MVLRTSELPKIRSEDPRAAEATQATDDHADNDEIDQWFEEMLGVYPEQNVEELFDDVFDWDEVDPLGSLEPPRTPPPRPPPTSPPPAPSRLSRTTAIDSDRFPEPLEDIHLPPPPRTPPPRPPPTSPPPAPSRLIRTTAIDGDRFPEPLEAIHLPLTPPPPPPSPPQSPPPSPPSPKRRRF